ncbi:MAG: prolyl oligopeptidase family serine peptidase [Armatimonadota bacterium]|nr:MAG: prolyl oligopeptidase family serine peptidase [Armatimonadota bacterium]
MSREGLDSLEFSLRRYDEAEQRLRFDARTASGARTWQARLRRRLVALLGGFPKKKCDLAPETLDLRQMNGYSREKIAFWSRPGLRVVGYFLLPNGFRAPGPAMLCLPGHGRGVDDIVGINEDGTQRTEWGEYQNDFALQAVANGFAALAIEQFGFGDRRDERARAVGPGNASCQPAAGAALLLGETMIGWRVYDAMRAVDYLLTRAEVDGSRIGCVGISGGGTTTLHAAAVDPRIALAFVSGYFNTYRDSIFSISHCMDNYIPGILHYAEMPDVAGLIAPRPFFAESGTKDGIFPVAATRRAFERLKEIYGVFGAEDRVGLHIFQGEHQFNGKRGWPFARKHLGAGRG